MPSAPTASEIHIGAALAVPATTPPTRLRP